MKLSPCHISLAAALCTVLLFSCSSDDSGSTPPPNEGISSSSAVKAYSYCVFLGERLCLRGTYYECPSGGILNNDCPFTDQSSPSVDQSSNSGSQNGSSSSVAKSSNSAAVSSSSGAKPSSSSVAPSSNSVVPSSSSVMPSSSSLAPSSSSVVPSSSSTTPSSSSLIPSSSSVVLSSSSNITACKDKQGRYLYCAWGWTTSYDNKTIYTDQCYALDPEYSDLSEPTCENLVAHCDKNGAGGSAVWNSTPYTGALFTGPYIEIDDDSFSCIDGGLDKYGDPWGNLPSSKGVLTGPYKLEQIEL